MSSITKFIFKLIISSILLYFIFKNIEISDFTDYYTSIPVFIMIVSLILAIIKVQLESVRWSLVLKEKKVNVNLFTLCIFYMIGGFFNIFLPSTIGGDALRIAYIKNDDLSLLSATNTVLFERLTGLYAIFIMTIIAVFLGWHLVIAEIRVLILTTSGIGILIMTLVYFSYNKFLDFVKIISYKYSNKITLKIYSSLKLLDFTQYSYKTLLLCVVFSILMQMIVIIVTALIGTALGLEKVGILHYLIILPPIWVIALLPISIGGFGVREGLFALFFAPLGVTLEQSTLLSLLSFFPFLFTGLLGGVFYLFGFHSYKEEANV